jgi:hypothetical protein
MNLVPDEFVGALQQGRGDEDDRGGPVADLFVLLSG